ncbi:MAG: SH3 domain-containing protein [Aggregatilineales bacterium]
MTRKPLLILFCLLAGLMAVAAQPDEILSGTAYQTVNIRSGPDTRFDIVGQLARGAEVLVTGRDPDGLWVRIATEQGQTGWLPSFTLMIDGSLDLLPVVDTDAFGVAEAEGDAVYVIAYGLVNVRAAPTIGASIVTQLDVDDRAPANARSNTNNDWLLIDLDEGQGWVAYFTVIVEGDPNTLPVLVPDASGAGLLPPAELVRTRFNTRLRDAPSLDAPLTTIVQFNSEVTPIARSADQQWLYVSYGDGIGWGLARLFDISDAQLALLPVYNDVGPAAAPPPTATAEPDEAAETGAFTA